MPHTIKKQRPFMDLSRYISKNHLFSGVSSDVLAPFLEAAQIRREEKGKFIFIQGDKAEWFYLIIDGWIKLFRDTIDGNEAVVDVLTAGHLFGESAIFDNGIYGYGAQLLEPTQYIMLPSSLLKTAVASDQKMAMNMLQVMAQHRRQQSMEIEHLNMQNAPQRIGCFLLRLCPVDVKGSVTLHLPYDKTLIAARLGMKPETFSRALATLKKDANIRVQGAMVIIGNIQELVDYTCNHCSNKFPCDDL